MKVTPDDYGRRCQFDHFCKLVLYHEAVDYFRERKRQRGWETSFETLPLSELDTLCTKKKRRRHGGAEQRRGARSAAGQSERGAGGGMSRSAVQRHRTKTLETMRTRLTGGIAE